MIVVGMAAFRGAIYFKNIANTVANKGRAFIWNGNAICIRRVVLDYPLVAISITLWGLYSIRRFVSATNSSISKVHNIDIRIPKFRFSDELQRNS